jgi:divinyl protochlorophyllide a 8-vinyl-reductase
MRTLALETATKRADGSLRPPARIGPNAIIQLGLAVAKGLGEDARRDLFRNAGLTHYLTALPHEMVDEAEVIALHRTLRASSSADNYRLIAWEAGLRTGDYILKNRIPQMAQIVLRLLPRGLAARALTAAIAKHSWTFAGSGIFRSVSIQPLVLEIAESPLCRAEHSADPLCDYYAGTFTQLYRSLVDPKITVVETLCGAVDGATCRFEEVSGASRFHRAGHPGA